MSDRCVGSTPLGFDILTGYPSDLGESLRCFEDVKNLVFSDNIKLNTPADLHIQLLCKSFYPLYTRDKEGKFISLIFLTDAVPHIIATFNGYMAPEMRHPQLSSDVATFCVDWYFKQFRFTQIRALINAQNRPSRLAAHRLGFKLVKVIPKFAVHNSLVCDYHSLCLTKDSWEKRKWQ